MVEISQIDNADALEVWLDQAIAQDETRGREIAVTIAVRVAARVMPDAWQFLLISKNNLALLQPLRSIFISWVAAKCPTDDIILVAARAAARAAAAITADRAMAAIAAIVNAAATFNVKVPVTAAARAAAAAAARSSRDSTDIIWSGVKADLRDFDAGKAPFSQPLWPDENLLADMWREIKDTLSARNETDKWAFWIWWYDGLLAGTAPSSDHQMFQDIALIPDDEWEDEDAVLSKINRIWRSYDPQKKADPAELMMAEQLLQAALSDFTFDTARSLMRMTPFAADLRFMEDPEALDRFLTDAEELADDIERLARGLARGSGGNLSAGLVSVELDAVLEELSKARQMGKLNVGKLVKYGEFLQSNCLDEKTLLEFGAPTHTKLTQITDGLLHMVRDHFGQTLLRFAPLRDLQLEAGTSAWEYLNELRGALKDMSAPQADGAIPELAPEDLAVLQFLQDQIERIARAHQSAEGPSRISLERELNYNLALATVTFGAFRVRALQATGSFGRGVEGIIKLFDGTKSLYELFKIISGLGS
jgi:hypothetical protein